MGKPLLRPTVRAIFESKQLSPWRTPSFNVRLHILHEYATRTHTARKASRPRSKWTSTRYLALMWSNGLPRLEFSKVPSPFPCQVVYPEDDAKDLGFAEKSSSKP